MTINIRDVTKIFNLEPKAIVFTALSSENLLTLNEISQILQSNFPNYAKHFTTAHIKTYFERGLPLNIIIEEEISSITHESAIARGLTHEAKFIVPIIKFALPYLPENFELSAFTLLGQVNCRFERENSPDARINILKLLSDKQPRTLAEINTTLSNPYVTKTHNKLNDLSTIVNIHGENKPFIIYNGQESSGKSFNYTWTGKHEQEEDFRYKNSKTQKLLRHIIEQGEDVDFSTTTINPCGFKTIRDVSEALGSLQYKGYVTRNPLHDIRVAKITDFGLAYVEECIFPIEAALKGDSDAFTHIIDNQPTHSQLEHALKIYSRTRQHE